MKPCALPVRRLVAAALGILLLLLILPSRTQPAAAEGAAAYGWWSQTTPTSAVTPPAPPDVPANGLFVENGPNGPVALSALTFAVPINAQIGELALTIAGSPALTRPPVACLATSAFSPVQNGAWTSRPTYDCAHEVPGNVDSNRTAVVFPVSGLAKNGELSIVVLAGGPVDRIAMNAPTANALTVTVAPGEVPSLSDGYRRTPAGRFPISARLEPDKPGNPCAESSPTSRIGRAQLNHEHESSRDADRASYDTRTCVPVARDRVLGRRVWCRPASVMGPCSVAIVRRCQNRRGWPIGHE